MGSFKIVKKLYWSDNTERYREWNDGLKCWYGMNGVGLHREDGPAVIGSSGLEEYWYNGEYLADVHSVDELIIKMIID